MAQSIARPVIALVALGSNLGDCPTIIHQAARRLEEWSVAPLRRSSLWQTRPVDCPPGSPLFVNAAVALTPSPSETPESLLEKLLDLESEFGRARKTILNEPRPLDLDLIAFGAERRSTARLVLPHPRACGRAFVLKPLAEIAPDFILPGQNQTVAQLAAQVGSGEVLGRVG